MAQRAAAARITEANKLSIFQRNAGNKSASCSSGDGSNNRVEALNELLELTLLILGVPSDFPLCAGQDIGIMDVW